MSNDKTQAFIISCLAEAIGQSETDAAELAIDSPKFNAYFNTALKQAVYYEMLLEEGQFSIHSDIHKAVILRPELAYWKEESERLGPPKFFPPVRIDINATEDNHATNILGPSYLKHFVALCMVKYLSARISELEAPSKPHRLRPFAPEELLNDDFAETIRQALEARGLLRDGEFIGNTTQVKALFNVLHPKFGGLTYPEEKFAKFFSDRFGFKVTGRTLQNPPNKKQDIEEREFRNLIPGKSS